MRSEQAAEAAGNAYKTVHRGETFQDITTALHYFRLTILPAKSYHYEGLRYSCTRWVHTGFSVLFMSTDIQTASLQHCPRLYSPAAPVAVHQQA